MSIFNSLELAPRDPILGLNEQFAADTHPRKVNLGVGTYCDANGKLTLLDCVRKAEQRMMAEPKARGYLPIDGIVAYDTAVKGLVFGALSEPVRSGRIATVQCLGGTGALKIGADFIKFTQTVGSVLISDPSWENHASLFSRAGFEVSTYPYYDAAKRGVNVDGMIAALNSANFGTVIVLHVCCHNPTGYDLAATDWDQVVAAVRSRKLIAFLDMAYQGFGSGIEQDASVIRKFVDAGLTFFIATSFSKSFGLYGERVGALSVLCEDKNEADRVLSQLKLTIRTNYSNPPTHGGAVVAEVLGDPELYSLWERELGHMRVRIRTMRKRFVEGLQAAGVPRDMSFITDQIGMFSYSGLTTEQMVRLRTESGVYGTDSGRICIAALNENNIGHVCASVAKVF